MKYVFYTVIVIAVLLIVPFLAFGLNLISLPGYQLNQNINRAEGLIKKVNDPNLCLGINKEFQELKQDIIQVRNNQIPNTEKAIKNFKENQPEDKTKWDFASNQAFNQLQSQLLGQQQYLSNLESKYNSFLNRDDTKPCRDNLPTFIEIK